MKLSALLEPLIAAGVSGDVILATVKAFEEQQTDALERRRANDRERQNRRRHVTSRDVTVTVSSREPTRVEDNLQTKNSTGQKENKKNTPRDELAAVLDADHADAVLEHRQKLRKPLTQRAAHLLAKKLAAAPDANAAADLMVEKGWLSFELAWAEKPTPRASGPPSRGGVVDAMHGIFQERGWNDEPNGISGGNGHAERLSTGRNGGSTGVVVDLRRRPSGDFGLGDHRDGTAFPPQRNS